MSEIIQRKDAKSLGLKWYFTGKPCKRGHLSEKQTANGSCRQCNQSYQIQNADLISQKRKAKYSPEKAKEMRDKNKDTYNENKRIKYHNDPEKMRAYMREQYNRSPDIWKFHAKRRKARVRCAEGAYAIADIKEIRRAQSDKCGYCRVNLNGGGHIDHIISLAKGGTNWPRNLQLLCVACNCSKKSMDPIEYVQKRLGKLL